MFFREAQKHIFVCLRCVFGPLRTCADGHVHLLEASAFDCVCVRVCAYVRVFMCVHVFMCVCVCTLHTFVPDILLPPPPTSRELNHPHIVRFLGACVRPPKLCYIMELCRCSVYKALHETRTPFSEQELVNIGVRPPAPVCFCSSFLLWGLVPVTL